MTVWEFVFIGFLFFVIFGVPLLFVLVKRSSKEATEAEDYDAGVDDLPPVQASETAALRSTSEAPTMKRVTPVFYVADVTKAFDFYKNRLGFDRCFYIGTNDAANAQEALVQRDGIAIFLNKNGKLAGRGALHIVTTNVELLCETYKNDGIAITYDLVAQPNGTKAFQLTDVDGNSLKIIGRN